MSVVPGDWRDPVISSTDHHLLLHPVPGPAVQIAQERHSSHKWTFYQALYQVSVCLVKWKQFASRVKPISRLLWLSVTLCDGLTLFVYSVGRLKRFWQIFHNWLQIGKLIIKFSSVPSFFELIILIMLTFFPYPWTLLSGRPAECRTDFLFLTLLEFEAKLSLMWSINNRINNTVVLLSPSNCIGIIFSLKNAERGYKNRKKSYKIGPTF